MSVPERERRKPPATGPSRGGRGQANWQNNFRGSLLIKVRLEILKYWLFSLGSWGRRRKYCDLIPRKEVGNAKVFECL